MVNLDDIVAAQALSATTSSAARILYETQARSNRPQKIGEAVTTMTFETFLPQLQDQSARQALWAQQQNGRKAALSFVPTANDIVRAQWEPARPQPRGPHSSAHKTGNWNRGVISIIGNDDVGTIFHENFHPAFGQSIFNQAGGADAAWLEAWCDAFRYACEATFLPAISPSDVKTAALATTMTAQQVMASPNDYLRRYLYPASLIIKASGGTMAGLLALWNSLVQQKRAHPKEAVLGAAFGYQPSHASKAVIAAAAAASRSVPPAHTPTAAASAPTTNPPAAPSAHVVDSSIPSMPVVNSPVSAAPPNAHYAASTVTGSGSGAAPALGVLGGAALGAAVGGPLGAFVGAVLGFFVTKPKSASSGTASFGGPSTVILANSVRQPAPSVVTPDPSATGVGQAVLDGAAAAGMSVDDYLASRVTFQNDSSANAGWGFPTADGVATTSHGAVAVWPTDVKN
jgi:hypothetical protein